MCRTVLCVWLLMFLYPGVLTAQVYSIHQVRSYPANAQTSVEITNKYGKINIITWNKDSVQIGVDLRISTNNYQKTQKLKNNISFEFTSAKNTIVAKTNFASSSGVISDFVDAFIPSNQVVINYMVYLPNNVNLKVDNKFGDIYIDDFKGNVDISLSNGDLQANKLTGQPTVRLSSGNGNINSIDGKVYVSYSDLRIRETHNLFIESRSSRVKIDKTDDLKIDSRRDKYEIDNAREVSATGYFTGLNIKNLSGEINSKMKYGNVTVSQVGDNFSLINLDSEYTDIDLYFNRNNSYNIDIKHHNDTYIKLPADLAKIQTKDIDPENKIKLTYGKIGTSATETSHKVMINAPKKCLINIFAR